MKRRFRCPEATKKAYVVEVLSGYRIDAVARKYGMSPKSLREWVRQYQDEVDELMVKKRQADEKTKHNAEQFDELQSKYKEAMKLLGEKELEINILREAVKKNNPHWK